MKGRGASWSGEIGKEVSMSGLPLFSDDTFCCFFFSSLQPPPLFLVGCQYCHWHPDSLGETGWLPRYLPTYLPAQGEGVQGVQEAEKDGEVKAKRKKKLYSHVGTVH